MRLAERLTGGSAPFLPLFCKELRDLFAGRALWVLLLLVPPLVGYSFIQAVALYAEASRSAMQFSAVARGLSPFDGIEVPTFGALYLAATFLFPFIVIRTIGAEKQNGGLKLLLQMPYGTPALLGAKLAVLLAAWGLMLVPFLCALAIWQMLGGHLDASETLNLLLGHLLYALVICGIGLLMAAIVDGSTAAIATLAFTIGFWVLDFAAAGQGGFVQDIAALSLTAMLRNFERGIFSLAVVGGVIAATAGLLTLTGVWLPPGLATGRKLMFSALAVAITAIALLGAARLHVYGDMTQDRRNSFPVADADILAGLGGQLTITVNLRPQDPRFVDMNRNLLGRLDRTMRDVRIVVVSNGASLFGTNDADYGLVTYAYGGRAASSRSTSPEEVLPLIYRLAGVSPPPRSEEVEYPGYPLVADASSTGGWFFAGLPFLTLIGWAVQSGMLRRMRNAWRRA
ncbi:MAG: ABC transporter permease subunit [Proteobacteria bacterium]|nr:ABC transporter permease subunit [Pseudomonadota bacterium]